MYESAGPARLCTQVLTVDINERMNPELWRSACEAAQFARTRQTTETAPPLVAHLSFTMQSYVQPDFRFISSFGSGGQKLGKMGSITDYMIRLTPSTIFGTKKKKLAQGAHACGYHDLCRCARRRRTCLESPRSARGSFHSPKPLT